MGDNTLHREDSPQRLAIIQRVLTPYRVPLFDLLSTKYHGGVSVFAGQPAVGETLTTVDRLNAAELQRTHNRYFFRGMVASYWQQGLRAWLERWQPDVLVAEANPRCLSTRTAIQWMHDRGSTVLGWGLGSYSVTPGLAHVRELRRRRFLRMFDGMLAYSSRAAAQYRDAGFSPNAVFVCNNAATFRPTSFPPQRVPHFSAAPSVLFVGRLTQAKRVDVLIRACALVKEVRPDLAPQLRVVGEGAVRRSLEELARRVFPDTTFLGALHGPPLVTEFHSADLFVLPDLGGLAIQEAMSYGLPVIAGKGDGTQDDLVRPENGWHVPSPSVTELARAMRVALSDAKRLRTMGAASFRIVADEINIDAMAATFVRATIGVTRG